jgi:ABC-type uncharacterized transport system substrate-binding protein
VPGSRGPRGCARSSRYRCTKHHAARWAKANSRLGSGRGLPTVYGYREQAESGGLISYGVNLNWCFHRAAYYVDKILKGATPAELPVEFPTRLQLVINLKAAKALGIEIAPALLVRADEAIE